MIKVQDGSFDAEVLQASLPVVVDFSAPWCGPCKVLEPILEDLSGQYEGRVKVVKVDVSNAPQTAMRYMVQSVPTVLFFRQGQVAKQLIGAVPRPKLVTAFEELLAG